MSVLADIGKSIGAIAPTLAGALGTAVAGPVGGSLARAAVSAIAGALGLESEDPDDVSAALAGASPEQLAALKTADQKFKERMRELNLHELQLDADDRDSARKREIALHDMMPGFIAVAVFIGFFGLLGVIAYHELPIHAQQPFNIMIGVLGSLVGQVGSYYFGSTHRGKFDGIKKEPTS